MYPVINFCPVCQGEMLITKLECRECDTSINGRFIKGPFASLSNAQLEFVELFVLTEGKITRMEEKLGLSYPTIRNRLHEIIRELGFEPGLEETPALELEVQKKILSDLDEGKISYEEALKLINQDEVR